VNQTKIAQAKPVLNAESFQRLLAAAYMLQVQNSRRLSIQPIGTNHTSPSAAGSTYSGRLEPFVGPVVLHDVNILSVNTKSWKIVEALAIAIVFCAMMGLSIHRLSAHPGNASLSIGTLEHPSVSQPARLSASKLTSDRQTLIRRNSRQPESDGEGDFVAKDTIIHYPNRSIGLHAGAADKTVPLQAQLVSPENTISTPRVRFPSGRAAGRLTAETVVQYGPDVTMWLANPKRKENR
jgi:hypothetical protein